MAFAFNNPSSKCERAFAALLQLQGKGQENQIFIANDSRDRVFPNRTVQVLSCSMPNPHRPEGVCQVQIVHHFAAALQPGETQQSRRVAMDEFLGDTMDTLMFGDGFSLNAVADAITAAGRWLAKPDPDGQPGDASDLIVQANLDMTNFRCDWVKLGQPFITRGKPEGDGTYWAEILNFSCLVSSAAN